MKSVELAFSVLESVAEHGPIGVSELARLHDVPKSTAQRSLSSLAKLGWIRTAGSSDSTRWVLTTKALTVGGRVTVVDSLRAVALPTMQSLSRETGETIHLAIRDGLEIVIVEKIDSTSHIRTVSYVGGRAPVYATSSGQAILSTLPADQVSAMFPDELESFTGTTIGSLKDLQQELEQVRRRGYAINTGQWRTDIAAVGAAIIAAGYAQGAVTISTPAILFEPELHDKYGTLVRDAAKQIGQALHEA